MIGILVHERSFMIEIVLNSFADSHAVNYLGWKNVSHLTMEMEQVRLDIFYHNLSPHY